MRESNLSDPAARGPALARRSKRRDDRRTSSSTSGNGARLLRAAAARNNIFARAPRDVGPSVNLRPAPGALAKSDLVEAVTARVLAHLRPELHRLERRLERLTTLTADVALHYRSKNG